MRVLLVDDHSLFLESMSNLLGANGYQVAGTASDGLAALDQARALRPDLILMDISMPRCDGLAATRLIKAEMQPVCIVMLTASDQEEDLFEAIKSGASGYLLKSLRAPEFLRQLNQIQIGEPPLSPGMAARIIRELARQGNPSDPAAAGPGGALTGDRLLSARQTQVMTLVTQGLTYAQVAASLHLSEATVRYHMGEIIDRLHLENRAQVIAYASRMGVAPK